MRASLAMTLAAVLVLPNAACRDTSEPGAPDGPTSDTYGLLPGLKATPHPGLRAELARIVDEGGTPELMMSGRDSSDEQNAALALAQLFPSGGAESVFERSSEVFPSGEFKLEQQELNRAEGLLAEQAEVRKQVQVALERPNSDFGIDYEAGFEADLSCVDVVWACSRLEALAAAAALAADNPDGAVECLNRILRLAACLARERHPTTRLEAAYIRAEAMVVLQAIADDDRTSVEMLGRLYNLVRKQLDAWPGDAEAWIGDRALGMWVYEVVRAGKLTEVLTPEELQRFADEGILADLPERVRQSVNEDELYYLETMRKIISACDRPYHTRAELFSAIKNELHDMRNSPEFPFVASRVLLPDIEKGHETQAQDRANWEALAMALAAATENEPPPFEINPRSGKPYEVVRQDGQVTVRNVGSGEQTVDTSIVLPDRSGEN
jgi:hypothetical protein